MISVIIIRYESLLSLSVLNLPGLCFIFLKTGMENLQHLTLIKIASRNLVYKAAWKNMVIMERDAIPVADWSSTNFQRKGQH